MELQFSRKSTGYMLAFIATIIWSGNFIVARSLSDAIPPVALAQLRWGTAVLAILPFSLRALITDFHIISENLSYIFWSALLGVTLFNTFVYIAAHGTSSPKSFTHCNMFTHIHCNFCTHLFTRAIYSASACGNFHSLCGGASPPD